MVANRRSIRGRRSSPDQGSIVTSRVENESPLMGFPSTNVPFFNANHRRIPSLATDHHPPFAIHGSQFERTSLLLCDIVPLVTIDLAEGRESTGGRLNRNLCTYSTYPFDPRLPIVQLGIRTIPIIPRIFSSSIVTDAPIAILLPIAR